VKSITQVATFPEGLALPGERVLNNWQIAACVAGQHLPLVERRANGTMRAMNPEWIGFAAAFLTSVSFIPQAVMTIRTRNSSGISRGMYTLFTVGVALWLAYGIYLKSWPMIAANTVTLTLAATILALKLRYG
jgi:MtN3 and saliva related transmembrane protein